MTADRTECLAHSANAARIQRTEADVASHSKQLAGLERSTVAHEARLDNLEAVMATQQTKVDGMALTIERWRGIGLSGVAIASVLGAAVGGLFQLILKFL